MLLENAALTVALAFAAGVIIQMIARSIRVPAIVLLLVSGVALGPAGLDWVRPAELGEGLFIVIDFAVAIILFEGALNLEVRRLRQQERVITRLITSGALVSLAGGAIAARGWLGWTWPQATLFGALIVVTGPTVVGPLVRNLRLHLRLRTVLEAEGVLIDPIGALLAVLVLQIALASTPAGVVTEFGNLFLRLAVGAVVGAVGGLTIAGLLHLPRLVHGLENVLTLALVVLLFHLSEHVIAPSGLVAVTVAGLVVGNLKSPVDDDLREFKDQLTILMIGAIFVLLAADVGLDEVRALGWPGVWVLASLIVVVRPLGVWVSMGGSGFSWREKLFVAAIAPRGIVAAAIASLAAGTLSARAISGGTDLRALVFLVIAGTVVCAGLIARPLATLLRLRLPARDRFAIVGAQGLGLALGHVLKEAGENIVFVDADPQRCRRAEADGFTVVFGDALEERTLTRVPIDLVGTAVGLTFNDHLNSEFVRLAQQTFRVGRGLVSVESVDGDRPPEHVARYGGDLVFEAPHDQERWDLRWRLGEVTVERLVWNGEGEAADTWQAGREPDAPRQEAFAILAIERKGRAAPMSASTVLRKDDVVFVALHTPTYDATLAALTAAGWQPAPPVSQPDGPA